VLYGAVKLFWMANSKWAS